MIKVLDMKFIRYANLFNGITRIRSNHCFEYNNTVIFSVPKELVMKAIGAGNKNLEKLSNIIGKKIKIVAIPRGVRDIESFVATIIRPIRFKAIEIKDSEVIINAVAQNKASLIGKNKSRLLEMENILGQYFGFKKVRVR